MRSSARNHARRLGRAAVVDPVARCPYTRGSALRATWFRAYSHALHDFCNGLRAFFATIGKIVDAMAEAARTLIDGLSTGIVLGTATEAHDGRGAS
jgi:hypothetical protein